MRIEPFLLERYFAKHEFSARHLLSSSDCEALSMAELLALADAESRRLWKDLRLGYTETPGHPALRESIAATYRSIGPDNILVVVPEEGIFLLMQALLKPGDHVVCTFPGYQSLYEVARAIGCEVTLWEPDEAQGWHFSVARLQGLLRDTTRLVVVNFPHNPTGYLPSGADFAALVDSVRHQGAYLLSDEMYRCLELDPAARLPAGCDVYERAISLSGLSKAYGLPGLRIGWVAARDAGILDRMSALKDYTTICNSAPSEILALMALRSRERILNRQQALIHRNIDLLDAFFQRYAERFSWNRPIGGSICFPRLLEAENSCAFCETLIQETGIMLVPSRMFSYGDRHVRIGFGRESLPEVLGRFTDYLDGSNSQ